MMSTGKLPLIQITGPSANFYEHCYIASQPDSNGNVASLKAAELLKASGLPDKTLSEIWECSDSDGKGYLTKYEFYIALKLVALAQNRIEPKMHNLHMSVSTPRLNVSSPINHSANSSISPTNIWSISVEEQIKYSKLFDGLDSNNGKLSGDAVKPVFINSKLPVSTLGQVWNLADIDKDGSLDRDEFILAMYLLYKCLAGEEPPNALHPSIIPPSKRRPPSTNSIQSSSLRPNTSIGSVQSSFPAYAMRIPSSDWVVGKLEKERYDTQFFAADKDKDGILSGTDIREIFVQSGLPQNVLAKIWDLCDVNKSGMLNSEQFALAMHLINDQISSAGTKTIPITLTADMIPPSLRSKSTDTTPIDSLSLNSFGLKAESEDIYKEIEILRRERAQLEQVCRQHEADYKSQIQDVTELQETLERTAQTAQTLSKQKEEAQHRLDELAEQKNRTQVLLDETRGKCKEERDQLEVLKQQIGSQSISIEEKRDDLKRLQGELNDLIREEANLRDQVSQHHARLVAIEHETSSTESHIVATEDRNKELESLRARLQDVLQQYDAAMANPDSVPDPAMVDELLASSLVDQDKLPTAGWANADDPFMKDDPFSSIADPFGGAVNGVSDPFSVTSHNTTTVDPFYSPAGHNDPFSAVAHTNDWASAFASNDHNQNTAFSIGNIDDIFKNVGTNDNSHFNHFQSTETNDTFGFGDSPFDNAPTKSAVAVAPPPPRPIKAPHTVSASSSSLSKPGLEAVPCAVSETDQLSWAKQESQREAREAETIRKREQADFELALKLSQVEYKTHERRKVASGKSKK